MAKSASAMAAVSEPLAECDSRFFGRDVHVLRNGYNPLDYVSIKPRIRDHLSIVYTGSVPEQRRMSVFFRALRILLDRGVATPENMGFYYYGPSSDHVRREAEGTGVSPLTHVAGIVARDEALGNQLGADILLHLTWPREQKGFYSGKIFEYLYARRNILAVPGDGNVVDDLLRETGAGISFESPEQIAQQLAEWKQEKAEHGSLCYRGREQEISKYNRLTSTEKLSGILDEISR
ncbi:MAG: glycosyltransferase family protein [Anaerolineae bacterium]